jgi:molecular chaperone HscB
MVNRLPDHFSLFGLEPRFDLDLDALESAYKRVQAQVHPDRFAGATAAERRIAMQWAAHANEALQTLRSPTRRAAHLCETHGVKLERESNTAMPAEFLMQQLEWREALDEAARGAQPARLAALLRQADDARAELLEELRQAIDVAGDYTRAAALTRQLMFVDKLHEQIDDASHALAELPGAAG